MDLTSVLSNDVKLRYDEARKILQVTTIHNGKPTDAPIQIRLSTLLEMRDEKEACRWFGETILLLIPEMREALFKLSDQG